MRSSSIQKILIGAVFFAVSSVVAVVGYWLAGWSLLEAIYMVIITIYGVGYSEVRPVEGPGLKLFTIGFILAGCTSAIYVLGGFVQLIAEGELHRFLGARRMTRGIEKLTDHAVVCGYGRVGRILARELVAAGQPFVLIDTDQERLQEAELAGLFVLVGDATSEDVLESAGVKRARVLASVLPDDAANVFITLTARELNSSIEIIARGESPSTERKLLRSGATRVVLPAAIGATRIARLITRPSVEDVLEREVALESLNTDLGQIGLQISEFRIPSNSEFVNRTLSDVAFGSTMQFVVIALRHPDGEVIRNPPPDSALQPDDTIIVLAQEEAIPSLKKTVIGQQILYRGARR
ncbi:MAG: potassium channel family protein [Planctomycetota bacterium]|jgi:voltage-gated potassium channel